MNLIDIVVEIFLVFYVIWCVAVGIMDIMVCAGIYYRHCDSSGCSSLRLYDTPGLEYIMSYWFLVYGATSITKLVAWLLLFVNPALILIIGTYLYITSSNINTVLDTQCLNETSVTCDFYENPQMYDYFVTINTVQLFGSVSLVILFPALIVCVFGTVGIAMIPSRIYEICSRFQERCCCKCYKNFCKDLCYIFCEKKVNDTSKNVAEEESCV